MQCELHLFFVGATGFEPATPWSQTRCATNCATPRKRFFIYTVVSPVYDTTSFCCRGDRIRTCDPLVPNQVRYQLRHAPRTFSVLLDILFSNERANLVLFFNNSNNFAHKNR